MAKLKTSSLWALALAVLLFTSCASLDDMIKRANEVDIKSTPNPLEMNKNIVDVTINGKIPQKYFNKNVSVEITPVLKYAGKEKELKKIVLQGEKVQGNGNVIKYETGGTFNSKDAISYEEGMQQAELHLKISGKLKDQSKDLGTVRKIGDGTIITCTYWKDGLTVDNGFESGNSFAKVADVAITLNPSTLEQFSAEIRYDLSKSDIRKQEKKSESLKNLINTIATNKASDKKYKGLEVSSFASPDGPLSINDKLSQERGKTANKFVQETFKKAKDEGSAVNISNKNTPEDWDGFKNTVSKSSIKDKELIIRVLSMYSDPDVREKEIKNISAAYKELKTDVLPSLRRSTIFANYEILAKANDAITAQANTDASKLNDNELEYAGYIAKDLNKKIELYKKALERNPNSWKVLNNLGVVYYQQNKISDASEALTRAKAANNNETVQNNLGAVAVANQKFEDAATFFNAAAQSGNPEAAYNAGILALKDFDAATAVAKFGNIKCYNSALAKVLTGDNDGALKILNEMPNKDHELAQYLKAIVGARTSNEDLTITSLRSAISKKASIKARAAAEAEFLKYRTVEAFNTILK